MDAIAEKGLKVTGIFGDFSADAKQLRLMTNIRSQPEKNYDAALITTKSYDTAGAVAALAALKGFDGPVVSMQNGCGNVEQLEARFGKKRTFAARVITGFEITSPGIIRITVSADDVHVGSCIRGTIPQFAHTLAEAINHASLPCIAVADIYQDLFAKLLYNCALNPLGAVLSVHYGALGDNPETRTIMNRVIDETFAVIHGLGGSTPWPDGESYRKIFYDVLLPATYNHRPSMLQDLEQGKPTEVEALVGYVAHEGQRLGIPSPTCNLLAGLVRFKEKAAKTKIMKNAGHRRS
jgi:2-dehydropantoate 2-reductase